MSLTRIVMLEARTWLVADRAGGIVARGRLGEAAPAAARTILVIPGAEVTVRWVSVKAAGLDQAAAALALMLEDEVSAPRESLHFAAGEAGRDGRRCVAIITRIKMQALLDEARGLGVTPDVVAPDCLMLPEPEGGLVAARIGGMVAVRGREVAFTAEPDLAEHLAGGRTMAPVEAEDLFGRAAAAGPPVNLLQGVFGGRAKAGSGWRLAAVLAGLVVLSPLAVRGAAVLRNDLEIGRIDHQMRLKVASAEASKRDVGPFIYLGSSVEEGRQAAAAVSAVFAAVQGLPGARLQSLHYEGGRAMRLTLVHDDPSEIARLASALQTAGYNLRQEASRDAAGRIATDLAVEPRS